MPTPILLAWSGGKDSAMALHTLRQDPAIEVVALLTTVTEEYDRVSMHGVRRELVEAQARSLGLPLDIVRVPREGGMETYEQRMARTLSRWRAQGVDEVGFGDVFLADVRAYRESRLKEIGMRARFPLWGLSTRTIVTGFVTAGFRAVITCVDSRQGLDRRFAGRAIDETFLPELPDKADPGGENGEYHSFVYDGPGFDSPVMFTTGEIVLRDNRFWYCDLLPTGPGIYDTQA